MAETIDATRYVFVFTDVDPSLLSPEHVLELYRGRWQIELAFKREKSIMGLGHLPKHDPKSCRAWLHGKLFVWLLAERLVDYARAFSLWGYSLEQASSRAQILCGQPVA